MTFSATSMRARASGSPRLASERVAAPEADSAIPSDADAWKRPALRLRSMNAAASPTAKPPRSALAGSSTPSKLTEWLPDARIPRASQSPRMWTPGVSAGIWAYP